LSWDFDDDFEENPDDFIDEEELIEGFEHVVTASKEYYTPFLSSKKIYRSITPDRAPTPKELEEALNKGDFSDFYPEPGLLIKYISIPANKVVPIPPGVYTHEQSEHTVPERLEPKFLSRKDEILEIGNIYSTVRKNIRDFLSKEHVYKEIKIIHKLGLLFYGKPGQGKSFLIKNLIDNEFKDAIVIYMNSEFRPSSAFINKLNKFTPDVLKVFIFEELTGNLRPGYLSWLLTFLDGENSVNKSIVIATTNYPEVLPENIVDRPSRFDKLYEFESPNTKERETLITHFMSRKALPEEIEKTKGFSVAAIKETCLMLRINDLSIQEAVSQLKDRSDKCRRMFSKSKESAGFTFQTEEKPKKSEYRSPLL
jgi:hypothetical protein